MLAMYGVCRKDLYQLLQLEITSDRIESADKIYFCAPRTSKRIRNVFKCIRIRSAIIMSRHFLDA